MDLSRIKHLIKHNGEKFILVENGEAELVVMSFKEYEKLLRGGVVLEGTAVGARKAGGYINDFSFDRLEETEFIPPVKSDSDKFLVRLEDIRLEDLPV